VKTIVALIATLWFPACASSPSATLEQASQAHAAGDWSAFLDSFTPQSRGVLELLAFVDARFRPGQARPSTPPLTLLSVRPQGDAAVARLQGASGEQRVRLVRADGAWRVDLLGGAGE
jgi:hypothetical protein